jgi:Fur family ferric uptake transcriptional regulator
MTSDHENQKSDPVGPDPKEILSTNGIRITSQRRALLQVLLEADDHPDVPELFRRAKIVDGSISLATIYRNLSVLEQAGIVERHSFEGIGARFEPSRSDHHDHIVDLETGEVVEFQSEDIEKLQMAIARNLGYDLIHHRLELYCRKMR